MDEEITIIDSNTRNEKIRNFFINNKKSLIASVLIVIVLLTSYFSFNAIKEKNKIKLANKFNLAIAEFETVKKAETIEKLINVIEEKDVTYSPLALYYLLDNNLIKNRAEINNLFDVLINETNLEREIKNLIIYKKALYNSEVINENELIKILNPIINSDSIWKSHALYLVAEYFYAKNEKQKAKEFFKKILILPNANNEIVGETTKRISRDLGE
jgi:predicted negative regulator of RcsB-dependent stress response